MQVINDKGHVIGGVQEADLTKWKEKGFSPVGEKTEEVKPDKKKAK